MDAFSNRVLRAAAAVAITLLASTAAVRAAPTTYELTFETTGQSIWDTGTSNVLNKTQFLGVAWQDQGVSIDAIAGDATNNVLNPTRVAYDAAFATCNLAFSASACINGQTAQAPVVGLGTRPSVRSCGTWAVGCQIARTGDLARRAAYDAAFATCRLGFSATVCSNGQPARLPVVALGTAPPQYLNVDTRTGFALNGSTDGRVGLELGVRMDSGSVDATVSFEASLDIPDTVGLDKANPISLNPGSFLAGANSLQTTFPSIEMSVDAVMQLSGSVSAEGCFVTQGCVVRATPIAINEVAPILSFNADGEGGIQLFGRPPSDFGISPVANGFPFDINVADLATITLHLPQPNVAGGAADNATQTLKGSAQDDLLDLTLDVDNIVATAAGVPGLFGKSFDIPALGSVGFDIINVSMGPEIDLLQDFELDPTLYVTLAFDQFVKIGGQIVDTFTSAWDMLPDITFLSDRTTVTPTFFVDALLRNQTLLDFDLGFAIDLLQIGYDFGALGKASVGVGNVLNEAVDLFRSPDLYSKLFALQGFNVAVGDSFVIDFLEGSTGPSTPIATRKDNPIVLAGISNATDIPEPGTLVLCVVALGGLVASRRRAVRVQAVPPAISAA